ncbi:hypothetical protein HHI36_008328 [Cryptolaemus montrouzieri]|uniref:Uncharacterized protein n=1 Tax=Cryptolaemus montrouzieri TaxID=559131 RepID=A0ABD2MSA0_9CUCU
MDEGGKERSRGGNIGNIDNQTINLIRMQGLRIRSVGGMEYVRKRKFADTSMEEIQTYRKKQSPKAFVVMKVLKMMAKQTEEQSGSIETYTRKEMKEISLRMTRNIAGLKIQSICHWLEKHNYDHPEKMTFDVDCQTESRIPV